MVRANRISKQMNGCKSTFFRGLTIIALLAMMQALPQSALSSIFWSGSEIAVDREEVVSDDIYILQTDAEIMGRVNGDVSALAQNFFLDGDIDGNLNILSNQADVEGTITKSLRAVCEDIQITGKIDGNILAVGKDLNIRSGSVVGRDVTCAGERITISGQCDGDVEIAGSVVIISGQIGGNLKVQADDIQINDRAHIAGDFDYECKNEAILGDNVFIGGKTNWTRPEKGKHIKIPSGLPSIIRILLFLVTLVTGYVLILLFKRHTQAASEQVLKAPGMAFAVGILTHAVIAIGGIIFFALILGIPVSLMMFALGIILFYIGKIYVAIALGRLVFILVGRDKGPIGLEFLIGLIALSLLFTVAVLGWILYILSFIVGSGAAVLGYLALNKKTMTIMPATEPSAPAAE